MYGLVVGVNQGQDLRWYRIDVVQTCSIVSILRKLSAVNLILGFISWDDVIARLCDFDCVCFEAAKLVSKRTVLV